MSSGVDFVSTSFFTTSLAAPAAIWPDSIRRESGFPVEVSANSDVRPRLVSIPYKPPAEAGGSARREDRSHRLRSWVKIAPVPVLLSWSSGNRRELHCWGGRVGRELAYDPGPVTRERLFAIVGEGHTKCRAREPARLADLRAIRRPDS